MTKTQRRRTARALRLRDTVPNASGAPRDHADATKLLQDPGRCKRLLEPLVGLVDIEFTSPFVDMETLCPEEAHLVVHLDELRGPATPQPPLPPSRRRQRRQQQPSAPDLQMRVARALDALASLCVTAQRLSRWDDLYQSFWERVAAESDVMMMPIQASTIDQWVRFTKTRGIPLLLSWSNKPFDPSQLMEPLQSLLSTRRPLDCLNAELQVTVGLRFVHATLTTSVIRALHELLRIPDDNTDYHGSLLIEPTCLGTLWLNSNPFYAPELSVLTAILSDPMVRRVDEFKLENFIVEDAPGTAEPAFDDALSELFSSVFALKPYDTSATIPPISLSLAENVLSSAHLFAFREAIAASSRPVRAFSLVDVHARSAEENERLIELVFLPLPMLTPCATLKWSRGSNVLSLEPLVRRFIESFWAAGDMRDQSIQCRLGKAVLSQSPDDRDPPVLSQVDYTIEDFHPSMAAVKLVVPAQDGSSSISGWVAISSITELRRNGCDVVCTGFARLVYGGRGTRDWFGSPGLVALTSAMGSSLTSLSLDHIPRAWYSLPEILSNCPQLQELSLERCDIEDLHPTVFCRESSPTRRPSIEILNLRYSRIRAASLQALEAFPLRSLQLLGNPIGAEGVESLLALLRTNKELRFVELNQQYSNPASLCVGFRGQIDALLDREYLHARDKAAVLSVLARQQGGPRLPFPGNDVVALVFAFVGTKPRRVVKWYY